MPSYIMQNSFAGGEYSPVIDARQDLQKYGTGVKTMKNFFTLPHGAAVNRPGTYFIAATKYSNKKSRLIPFVYNSSIAYELEFGETYIRFYRNGGQLTVSGTPYEIISPYGESDLDDIKFTQSADVLYLVHPNYPPKTLSRYGDTSWTLADFAFKLGPFAPMNLTDTTITPSGTSGSITLTASASVFNSNMVGALFKLEQDIEAQVASSSLAATNAVTSTIRGMGTWLVTTHGTWTGKIYVEKSEDSGTTWRIVRTYSSNSEYNIDASGSEDDQIVMMRVRMYSYTSGTCNVDLQFEPYTSIGVVKITAVTSTTVATGTVTQELGSTIATKYWYEGAWSNNRGWPCAVVFYQNRLTFAGTNSEPQTPWTSKTGDYVNFGVSSPVVDDDAITSPLVAERVNAIQSLKALSQIIALTSGGYWTLGPGNNDSAFTPSNQSAVQHGAYGSSGLDPIIIGNRIIFVQAQGSAVRDLGYSIEEESYTGDDITLLAEHLFRNRKIISWAYQQEPCGIIWCVCDDGIVLGLTYLKEQSVIGWHRHITYGEFESVSVIPGSDRDEVWFIVKRTINGATVRYVEQMASRITTAIEKTGADGDTYITYNPEDQYFVDCGLTYNSATAATTISGLAHLEGKTVSILADGNVHPQRVVSGGSITLDHAANVVHVGLGYTCDLKTLNIDFQAQDGTVQARYKRISAATLRLENARGAFVGADFNKMYEFKMRSTEAYGEPIALFSGDKSMPLTNGSTKEGRVCIRVSDPIPISILAIIREVELNA